MSDNVAVLRTALWDSFLRCSLMGGKPARLSTPPVGDVQKAPVIQQAAFLCMEVSVRRAPFTLAPSKYHSLWPSVRGYRNHARTIQDAFVTRGETLVELPSILTAMTVVRALVA